jgi:uncharacterized protein (DUF1778 family)
MDEPKRSNRRRTKRLSLWVPEEDFDLIERAAWLRHESVNSLGNRGLMREVARAGLLSREEATALEVDTAESTPNMSTAGPMETKRPQPSVVFP